MSRDQSSHIVSREPFPEDSVRLDEHSRLKSRAPSELLSERPFN